MGSALCEIVLITTSDIHLLRLNEHRKKLVHMKTTSVAVSKYWIFNGIVLLAAPAPRLGVLHAFFLKQNKLKDISGPKITLDLEPAKVDNWATETSCKHESRSAVPHKVLLCCVYERHVLVHMNCLKGEAYLYSLDEAFPYKTVVCPEPGDYELACKDNLLLCINVASLVTYIFDIKSTAYDGIPFCTVLHNTPTESCVDLHPFARPESYTKSGQISGLSGGDSGEFYAYSELPERNLRFVNSDLSISPGVFYKLELNCQVLVQSHPDLLESASFLLRRTGHKLKVFEYIKSAIRQRVSLMSLSKFFKLINFQDQEVAEHRFISTRSQGPWEPKSDASGCAIQQSEFSNAVFPGLFDDRSVEDNYLAAVLLEYIRNFMDRGQLAHTGIQQLLVRVLIRAQAFATLEQLTFSQVFTDSIEIAQLILDLSYDSLDPAGRCAYQLGVDMLFRIRAREDIADALVRKSMVVESLPYLSIAYSDTIRRHREETAKQHPDIQQVVRSFLSP